MPSAFPICVDADMVLAHYQAQGNARRYVVFHGECFAKSVARPVLQVDPLSVSAHVRMGEEWDECVLVYRMFKCLECNRPVVTERVDCRCQTELRADPIPQKFQ